MHTSTRLTYIGRDLGAVLHHVAFNQEVIQETLGVGEHEMLSARAAVRRSRLSGERSGNFNKQECIIIMAF